MRHALILLNGPSPGAGVTVDPDADEVTLGRDVTRTLPIDDERCSRLHARLWFDSQSWQIEDCDSRNGTFVNSRRIERAVLRPGDIIRIGETLIVFSREHDADDPRWHARRIATSTFVVRVAEDAERPTLIERLRAEQTDVARAAAVLCQLASDLQRQDHADAMVRVISDAVMEAVRADSVTIWLVSSDGRLSAVGGRSSKQRERPGDSTDARSAPVPVLASMSIENNESLLVQNGSAEAAAFDPSDTRPAGGPDTVISVPIPGRGERLGAIECVVSANHGAFDEHDLDVVIAIAGQAGLALENLNHRERLQQANQQLRTTVHGQQRIVGDSPAVRGLFDTVSRIGPVDSTILIRGESGTGKELVARMIHETSRRHSGPYIPINCAAFSESLLESELFGHEKGAFTGADQRRIGQFERAHTGTLFLDEVGELSPACQARLLRILEHHPFERVGGVEPIQVDVRVIAATHRDLPELVAGGRFRDDLYFRLKVIEVRLPPLRDRGDDVLLLADHFLLQFRSEMGRGPRGFSAAAAQLLMDYHWPGNVRELRNAVERAVVLSAADEVQAGDLGLPIVQPTEASPGGLIPLADAELRHIVAVLERVNGNKTQACKVLGIGRGTLYKKLEECAARGIPV
ncbi:MAG: sigma 54-interacting transcriptional regulator [Planctomycetaceae bacterium]